MFIYALRNFYFLSPVSLNTLCSLCYDMEIATCILCRPIRDESAFCRNSDVTATYTDPATKNCARVNSAIFSLSACSKRGNNKIFW